MSSKKPHVLKCQSHATFYTAAVLRWDKVGCNSNSIRPYVAHPYFHTCLLGLYRSSPHSSRTVAYVFTCVAQAHARGGGQRAGWSSLMLSHWKDQQEVSLSHSQQAPQPSPAALERPDTGVPAWLLANQCDLDQCHSGRMMAESELVYACNWLFLYVWAPITHNMKGNDRSGMSQWRHTDEWVSWG